MGFLDRLLGREPEQQQRQSGYAPPRGQAYSVPAPSGGASADDERAIARYKYLLRTAPPETIERTHAEAFAALTQEQRQMVLQRMSEELPPEEAPRSAEPQEMARAATRAEMRDPGYMQRSFGGGGFGMGFGSSMMGTIAGVVVGSMIADAIFDDYGSSPEAQEAGDPGPQADGSADAGSDSGDSGDAGSDSGADAGDAGGSDFSGGGDWGGGGDFGGGDFGGGFGGDF